MIALAQVIGGMFVVCLLAVIAERIWGDRAMKVLFILLLVVVPACLFVYLLFFPAPAGFFEDLRYLRR